MTALGPLDWTICLAYLAIVIGLGAWFARQQHSNEDYFVGGRKMHWLPIGLSIFAGTFSSLSFVGLPRDAAYDDWHLLTAILFIPLVVMPLVGWLFLPLYFKLHVTSAYEYLEHRFDRRIRKLASGLFMLYVVGWMGNLLLAVGKIVQPVMHLSSNQLTFALILLGALATVYTTLGGVKAVVWTDTLQAFALGGGMLTVLLLAVARINGGWDTVLRVGQEHHKFDMFQLTPPEQGGHFFAACAFGFFVYLAGHAVNFTAVQRYVSMPTLAAARWSLAINGVMVAVVCTIFFLVGTTIFVFYHQVATASDQTANLYAELEYDEVKQANGEANREDQLLPLFMLRELTMPGLMGLLLAGLFAAAMSSMDSGINSLTATIVCDWLGEETHSLGESRVLTCLFGAQVICVALFLQRFNLPVFHILMTIAGTFLGLMLGLFLIGMSSRRATTTCAMFGLAGGAITIGVAKYCGISFWWDGACTTLGTWTVGVIAGVLLPGREDSAPVGDTSVGK